MLKQATACYTYSMVLMITFVNEYLFMIFVVFLSLSVATGPVCRAVTGQRSMVSEERPHRHFQSCRSVWLVLNR